MSGQSKKRAGSLWTKAEKRQKGWLIVRAFIYTALIVVMFLYKDLYTTAADSRNAPGSRPDSDRSVRIDGMRSSAISVSVE